MTSFHGPEGQEDMPYLLTPGPLTTSRTVKMALMADWGSRDVEFRQVVREIREELLKLAGCDNSYECVLMQGSGTFAIEAALGSLTPAKRKKTLILANGAYGERAAQILEKLGRNHVKISKSDTTQLSAKHITKPLEDDLAISHVWVVHCETTSGIVNPLSVLAKEAKDRDCVFMVDAMSSFGALDINMQRDDIDVMVSSSNKCIEGVPGFGFVIARKAELEACKGNSHSLSLDVHAQWVNMVKSGQWRYTPPTHVVAAFMEALRLHAAEGGVAERGARYTENRDVMVAGMRALGFETLLIEPWLSPIIVTFFCPADPAFEFSGFYDLMKAKGFIIYPGKLTVAESFRIGVIGRMDAHVMSRVVQAARECLIELGVTSAAPPASALAERAKLTV